MSVDNYAYAAQVAPHSSEARYRRSDHEPYEGINRQALFQQTQTQGHERPESQFDIGTYYAEPESDSQWDEKGEYRR